jgi:hypothetical protein
MRITASLPPKISLGTVSCPCQTIGNPIHACPVQNARICGSSISEGVQFFRGRSQVPSKADQNCCCAEGLCQELSDHGFLWLRDPRF